MVVSQLFPAAGVAIDVGKRPGLDAWAGPVLLAPVPPVVVAGGRSFEREREREREREITFYQTFFLRFKLTTCLRTHLAVFYATDWVVTFLAHSPLFNDVVYGVAPHVDNIVNGNQYHLGYYLAYEIYPRYATLVKTISSPDHPEKSLFAQMQEAYRKKKS
ncbi:unnamed protein product [Prunus armeniaca]